MALKTTLTQPTASGTGTVLATPGMPGAANPVRIVGRNASGAPTTGTFQVGDVVVNTDGTEYVCSVAGTPGTWVQIGAISYGTPSNIDASITSLSAGSLTTVARADHIHTLSKVPVLLATTTLSSNSSAVNFTSFPASYTAIEVRYLARSTYTGAVGDLWFRVNSLSTSIYYSSYTSALETKIPLVINAAGNYFGVTATTLFSSGSVLFANYTSTSNAKSVLSSTVYTNSTTGWAPGFWSQKPELINTTSAITSINITASADNIASGSIFELWGWP